MTQPSDSNKVVYVSTSAMLDLAKGLLRLRGVSAEDAGIVAQCLVGADLRGVDTHGMTRLPGYLKRLELGLINPTPKIDVKRITPIAAAIDGQDGFGFVVATRAMAEAIDMAKMFGVGIAGVRHSTHFGMAASYVIQAIEAGFIGLVYTNSAASMPPWGGRRPLFGSSPLAAGAPGGRLGPFVFDMASAVAARGKIRKALRRGEQIPVGYALDRDGKATTDPARALEGVILPVGGPKGSGIAMMMDVFAGVITGAGYGGDVADQFSDFTRPQNVGHLLLAMRPDLFVPMEDYKARMDVLIERVHNCPPAEGFTEVLVAGEIEARKEALYRKTGIPYSAVEVSLLQEEAAKANLPPLVVSENPIPA